MREYEMEVLEKYELEVNSTRRIRGAFYCDTKEGTMLLKETKISERRVPLLYLILNRLEKQGYLVDTPVFSKEGNLVQNSRDGTRYLMKKWYPGEECNLKREEDIFRAARKLGELHLGFQWYEPDLQEKEIFQKFQKEESISFIKGFAKKKEAIVIITGAIDLVTDGEKCYVIRNGRSEMGRITGTGCQLSGITTAFLAANPERKLEAAVAAVCMMGVAGEIAWTKMREDDGNATYRNRIIDAIYNMTGEKLEKGAKYELY